MWLQNRLVALNKLQNLLVAKDMMQHLIEKR
jgi:hypothetical protein